MPSLPPGLYDRVVIHDNYEALKRFAGQRAVKALTSYNGRYMAFRHRGKTLIATGMGSAQTNCLVECLAAKGCQSIVKVGTCSALDRSLNEGDVIVPRAALVDEGSTFWRQVKEEHDLGAYRPRKAARQYVVRRTYVRPNTHLVARAVQELQTITVKAVGFRPIANACVWSVDSYDCFDGSPELYGRVDGQQYLVREFSSQRRGIVRLAAVEMECSALFATARDLEIPAVALIVVSRSRDRLIASNVRFADRPRFGVANSIPERDEARIRRAERACFEIALQLP